ncbi:MAG: YpdA family putative bacillithiol disulfide reductase [Candidatus Eisenbacteria bacterium]
MTRETLIVGAGPIGLACAISAKRRGIDPLVIDAGAIAQSIVGYPIGMVFFTTPELLEIGGHPLVCVGQKPSREEALKYYRGVARAEELRVLTYTKLLSVQTTPDGPVAIVQDERSEYEIPCERVVLATGYFERPRRLGVDGEDLPHVCHYFDEAHRHWGRSVVVVGGGNSAAEAALELFRAGAKVTLVHRRAEVKKTVKYWVRPDLANRIAAGEIDAYMESTVERFVPEGLVLRKSASGGDGEGADPAETTELHADRVFVLVGFLPDQELYRRIGIALHPETGVPTLDPDTYETNVPGVHMVGSITRGFALSDVFIENGRFDGEKVFGGK